jgi:hypothetical protein
MHVPESPVYLRPANASRVVQSPSRDGGRRVRPTISPLHWPLLPDWSGNHSRWTRVAGRVYQTAGKAVFHSLRILHPVEFMVLPSSAHDALTSVKAGLSRLLLQLFLAACFHSSFSLGVKVSFLFLLV